MKTYFIRNIVLISLFLILLSVTITSSLNIAEEDISKEDLQTRIDNFNKFYHEKNPTSKNLELRLNE